MTYRRGMLDGNVRGMRSASRPASFWPKVDGHPERDPVPVPTAWLPHQCDRWVIGGVAEVEALIADLQDFLIVALVSRGARERGGA